VAIDANTGDVGPAMLVDRQSEYRANAAPSVSPQVFSLAFAVVAACAGAAQAAAPLRETIVFVRDGEKPAQGYGQLDCQGLNRALALPAVIAAKFGKPMLSTRPIYRFEKRTKACHTTMSVRSRRSNPPPFNTACPSILPTDMPESMGSKTH
jgi:hypothetical protein